MASLNKRGRSYQLSFYFEGTRYRTTIGKVRKREAEKAKHKAEGLLSLIKAGLVPPPPKAQVVDYVLGRTGPSPRVSQYDGPPEATETELPPEEPGISVEELIDEYKSYAEPPSRAPSSYRTEMTHLRHFESFLGEKLDLGASEIDCRLLEEYKRHRSEDVQPQTVNKELQTLRQVFALAERYGYLQQNPVDQVKRLKDAQPERRFLTKEEIDEIERQRGGLEKEELTKLRRFRYLTRQEVNHLLDLAAGTELDLALTIAAYTGIRRGELLRLEWSDVDLKAGKIRVQSRKGSQSRKYQIRYVDIHPRLRRVLSEHRGEQPDGQYVVTDGDGRPWRPNRAQRALKRLTKQTDFEGIGFHTLRHSFSSNLAAAGVDDRTIDYRNTSAE